MILLMYGCFFFNQLVIIIVLSNATVLLTSCFLCMYFLAMYYESDVMLCRAWISFLELGQAPYT